MLLLDDLQRQKDTTTYHFYNVSFILVSKGWFAARDCYDLLMDGNNVSGVYEIYLAKARKFVRVYCDMDGGWLVRTQTQSHIYEHISAQTKSQVRIYT